MLFLLLLIIGLPGMFLCLDHNKPLWFRLSCFGFFIAFLVVTGSHEWLREKMPRLAWIIYDLEELDGPCPPKNNRC